MERHPSDDEDDQRQGTSNDSWKGWLAAGAVAVGAIAAGFTVYNEKKETQRLGVQNRAFKCKKNAGKCNVYLDGQKVSRLPCGDSLHSTCIFQWLAEKQSCPVCLKPVSRSEIDALRREFASSS